MHHDHLHHRDVGFTDGRLQCEPMHVSEHQDRDHLQRLLSRRGHACADDICRFEGAAAWRPGEDPLFMGKWAGHGPAPELAFHAFATQPGIVEHLRAEGERVYGDCISVVYGMRAVAGNVCAGELILEDPSGEQHTRRFDMVIGADGAKSTVRQLMQEQVCQHPRLHL